MDVDLSEKSLKRLADLIGEKILAARDAPEPWINIDTLAAGLGLSKKTIYKYTSQTDIPHKHGRPLRFRRSEVEAWLKKR
jgi:excisionase family DNA binding protein